MSLKKIILAKVLFLFAGSVFALSDISTATDSISSLTDKLAPAMPAAAGVGLDWSDAWVGYLTGVPPHFGVGLTFGVVTIPSEGFKPLFDAFGASLPSAVSTMGFPLPVYNLNARLGGFFLPFDLGFKLGIVPKGLLNTDFSADYLLLGGDFRYALLQDGITPGVSLGLGVNYLTTNIKAPISGVSSKQFAVAGGTVTLGQPTATLGIDNLSLDLKAQISKNLLILTPYVGGVLTLSGTTVKASVDTPVTLNGVTYDQINAATGANFNSSGFSKTVSKTGVLGFKIYGGTSINIMLFKIDLQALYNLPSGNLGLTVGTRFQL